MVADTIRNQIGAKALFMIGAKNLIAGENYLSFRIGKNSKRVSYIKITLNGLDLYDMEFINIRKYQFKTLSKVEDVYFDKLNTIIESNTGLYTSL